MTPELAFSIVNVLPLPIWAAWMLAPRSRLATYFDNALWPFAILCAAYVVLLVTSGVVGGPEGGSFSSLAGVQIMFDAPWGALTGWMHYLAFDPFVGRWIRNDAKDPGYRLAPVLFATFMFGPVGLLIWIGLRRRMGRSDG
jgi:hypothetical protein